MSALTQKKSRDTVGTNAFGSLRAEDEPWLHNCFVPPPGFERIVAQRSVIVFGDPGSGKTAICRELHTWSQGPEGKPVRLLVDWRPTPLRLEDQSSLGWVKRQVAHIFDACACSLADHLVHHPDDYVLAPNWSRTRVTWFIRRFMQGDSALRLAPLAEAPSRGSELIRQILEAPIRDVLYEDATPDQVAAELISTLKALGLNGIWVMSDGLGGWAELDTDQLTKGLSAFLSTLPLFEQSGIAYKLWVPARLEPALSHAGGLARRRVDSVHIRWDVESLRRVVERRLALAVGQRVFRLEDLCDAPGLEEWLKGVGGDSPRAWLDQVSPLFGQYVGQSQPLDESTWHRLRHEHPPRIYLDKTRRRVIVGGQEVDLESIPSKAYDMLCYLYQRGGQLVTKAELYFLAYRGLGSLPRSPADKHFEGRKEYEGLVDTNLWRLRKAIEPDPSDPVLLITKRGHGVVLKVRW